MRTLEKIRRHATKLKAKKDELTSEQEQFFKTIYVDNETMGDLLEEALPGMPTQQIHLCNKNGELIFYGITVKPIDHPSIMKHGVQNVLYR